MRLLITLGFPPAIGGMQNYLWERCKASLRDMIVLAPWLPDAEAFDSTQEFLVFRWPNWLQGVWGGRWVEQFISPLATSYFIIRKYPVAWIECGQALPFGLIALLYKCLFGIPYWIWAYGDEILKPQRFPVVRQALLRVLRDATGIGAISTFTKSILTDLGVSQDKIAILNPPIDRERFQSTVDADRVVRKHQLTDKRIILTVCRLVERKGIDKVIASFPYVLQRIPNAVYVVVGDGNDRTRLESLARKHGVQQSVFFTGIISYAELLEYYAACDIFVMVSRKLMGKGSVEGFGIVYLEAGALGKPVVAGRGGGVADAVEDGVTGFLVDPEDPQEIAEAICNILMDPEIYEKMKIGGKQRAFRPTDWHRVSEMMLSKGTM